MANILTSKWTYAFLAVGLFPVTWLLALPPLAERGEASGGWKMHDMNRPQPKVVDPGPYVSKLPPLDAVVLLGEQTKNDSKIWKNNAWEIKNGVMTVGKKNQETVAAFGDCQLHLEFRVPAELKKEKSPSQGNSGVFLMGNYEMQVLSSHPENNIIYADGMAGAIYGQNPPMVNPNRKIGEWNTYDIIFRRPHFDAEGRCIQKAVLTVFLNDVLVQDHFELMGPTTYVKRQPYKAHADRLPLKLQDHGSPVEYRNIWVRDLEKIEQENKKNHQNQ